ncbi:MAG: hypothetical protein D6706_04740 [Chloroflexi bacterium]|nr:MAG: hypothetical protein D6706_04740 [Chloroflexota bacterium]
MITATATITGRAHRLAQINGQDFAVCKQPAPGVGFGLVLDGCGSKVNTGTGRQLSRSESGAQLLGQFAATWLSRELAGNTAVSPQSLVANLYTACYRFIASICHLHPFASETERTNYLATHWLCTLVGFVWLPETAVFFWRGDGYLGWDEHIQPLIATGNAPDYLAYDVWQRRTNGRFYTQQITTPRRRLVVATDGWTPDLLCQLQTAHTPLTLQRWLNIQARQRGQFDDDGAIAICFSQNGET